MALVMTERKVVLLEGGKEKKVFNIGDPAPKEWAGKPFVKDTGKKTAE